MTEYDPQKPWVVVSVKRGMTVELEDSVNFFSWAHEHWPTDRYSVELDPYQL